MAGSGFLVNECNDSIMQLDKFKARKAVNEARLSGISVNRLEDRSNE